MTPTADTAKQELPPLPFTRWQQVVSPLLAWAVIALLYAFGISQWLDFFNGGDLDWTAYDWPKEYAYYSTLQEALRDGQLPWHMANKTYHGTDRFLALPETLLSPQILLLPFVDVGLFIIFQTLLLYALGFIGCLLIKRRYQLSVLPFAILVLLYGLNGYIVSHLAAGHSMWNGYFLLPFFGLFVLQMIEGPETLMPALKLALVLFAMILQGSFHMVVWCWMFLFLFGMGSWRYWRQVLLAVGFSGALALFRLVPAAIAFWDFKEYEFLTGYPTLTVLLDALTTIQTYKHPRLELLYWWEFDLYVGVVGFAFLVGFGICLRFARDAPLTRWKYQALDIPLIGMMLLSLTDVYECIDNLPLPLVNAERVSSRFLIIPVVMLLLIGVIRMQRLLEKFKPPFTIVALLAAGIWQLGSALCKHLEVWKIAVLEQHADSRWMVPEPLQTYHRPDAIYTTSVLLSALGSAGALIAWLYCWRHFRRRDLAHEPRVSEF